MIDEQVKNMGAWGQKSRIKNKPWVEIKMKKLVL